MAYDLDPDVRDVVLAHVLRDVYPDRREAEVIEAVPVEDGTLVGVQVHPRGYISTAKYALVTVDEAGTVVDAERRTGTEVRRAVEPNEE